MPPKRRTRRRPRQQGGQLRFKTQPVGYPVIQQGEGFFGDLWSGVKRAAGWVKDQKIISRGLSAFNDPRAKAAGAVAGAIGFGKKRGGLRMIRK